MIHFSTTASKVQKGWGLGRVHKMSSAAQRDETHRKPSDEWPVWQRCNRISLSARGSCLAKDMVGGLCCGGGEDEMSKAPSVI